MPQPSVKVMCRPSGSNLPSGLLVLDGAVIVLKLGIALLPGLVGCAVLIEAANRKPSTVSTGLTGLRVEA